MEPSDIFAIYLRVPRHEIAYVKFIFESYEDVAVCRTLDPRLATIAIIAAPDFAAQVERVTAALEAEGVCTRIPRPEGEAGDVLGPDPVG